MRRRRDEPNMSDRTLLVSVEDLINMAMGPPEKNIINYKIVQQVLHILARQMRILEQRIEIRIIEEVEEKSPRERKKKSNTSKKLESSTDSSSSKSPRPQTGKTRMEKINEEGVKGKGKMKEERSLLQEYESGAKEKETQERATSKEREKAEKVLTMEKDKEEPTTLKEKEKVVKEREKEEQTAMKEKVDKAVSKEKDRVAKAIAKEKDRETKAASKGFDKIEKERDKAEREDRKLKDTTEINKDKEMREKEIQSKGKKAESRGESVSSSTISEVERQKEKVLVVEKGPMTRTDVRRRESIEIVTRSQFEMLEALVKDLKDKTGPLPSLALPDNKELRSELVRGSASLIDTMNAMQVNARVEAAEQAISRMSELLTELATAGVLPEDFVDKIEDFQFEPLGPIELTEHDATETKSRIAPRKAVAIHPSSTKSVVVKPSAPISSVSKASIGKFSMASHVSHISATSDVLDMPKVTHMEMNDAVRAIKAELMKNMQLMTTKATATAETAVVMAKSVAEKLDVALQLNARISNLYSVVSDYEEQLSGFDVGLTTQMQGFQEQMAQIRSDLKNGLAQLEQVNNNAETAAVAELTERYEGLLSELDHTLHLHKSLTSFQNQLGGELHSLVECVEMLREQKADRDEVLDGLRDKADNSRLAGLLSELDFATARAELERRLEACYDKFNKQDNVWMMAIKDLTQIADAKAELMQLLGVRDEAQDKLRDLHEKLQVLALILGEPKAAILTRKLSRGATCGACMASALMEPEDASYGAPAPLPPMRPRPTGAAAEETEEPCLKEWKLPEPPDSRDHTCHRWCGGSHTLVTDMVTRQQAKSLPFQLDSPRTKRFTGYGTDGRLYMMEEDLQPCLECNVLSDKIHNEIALPSEDGAGDN